MAAIETDKLLHALACGCITLGVYAVLGALLPLWAAGLLGAVVGMGAGLLKEWLDSILDGGTGWSNADLLADGIGTAAAVVVIIIALVI